MGGGGGKWPNITKAFLGIFGLLINMKTGIIDIEYINFIILIYVFT